MAYLINSNNELFVYDQISNRNKNREYKFSLSLEDLISLKNEIMSVLKENCMTNAPQEEPTNN